MKSVGAAACAAFWLSLVSWSTVAAPLPPPQLELGAHGALGPDQVSDQFGTLESLFNGGGARATATEDQGTSLRADVWRSPGTVNGDSIAYAHQRYWFEVLGPGGTVSVDLAGQGRVSTYGPFAMGGGVGSAISFGTASGDLLLSKCAGGYLPAACGDDHAFSDRYTFSSSFDLQANTAYFVDLWVYTWLPPGSGSTPDISWATASLSLPRFSGGGAEGYAFSYSSPVPEPGTLALAATGLLLLAWRLAPRRAKPSRR